MMPATANPTVKEYSLCKEFKWSPDIFDTQVIKLPSRINLLKWLFLGKPLKLVWRKGLDNVKIEKFMSILSQERVQQEEEVTKMEREAMVRGGTV